MSLHSVPGMLQDAHGQATDEISMETRLVLTAELTMALPLACLGFWGSQHCAGGAAGSSLVGGALGRGCGCSVRPPQA